MGSYLNPGNEKFFQSVNSEIFGNSGNICGFHRG